VSVARTPWSTRLLRALLRLYPREFRERFAADLAADFDEILAARGRRAAWSYALADLRRALPMVHSDDQRARQRRYAVTLGGEDHMESLSVDLRHALRALVKSPVFTGVTVLTLGLGIGATSAVFSLVNAVLLSPLGYRDPDRLVAIHEVIPESMIPRFGVSPADFIDLRTLQGNFTDLGIYRVRELELSGTAGGSESIVVADVSAAVFPLLGASAVLGRTFLPEEDGVEPSSVVIGDGLRRRRFAGASPIGERLMLDRRPYTIVGVMPPGFVFPPRGPQFNGQPADAYLPRVFNPFEREARGMFYNHSVIGRLKDGMTREQATRDTAALASRVTQNYPSELRGIKLEIAASAFVDEISGAARRPLLMLLGAVFLVLLVACANLANLFLCRAVAREREMGVRTAIGAGRHRLVQLLLAESLLLAVAGGALGLAIARVVLDAIPAVLTTRLPGVSGVALDVRVVAFAAVLSVGTALFFGLAPLVAGRRAPAEVLREGARSVGGRRQGRVQAGLVVASVTLAFVLLVCAGLLGRSFARQMNAESGIHAPNVLSVEVTLPPAAYDRAASIRSFYQTVVEGVRAIPGVRAAAIASDLPLRPDGERRAFTPEVRNPSSAPQPAIALTWAHGDYFSSFGIPILRGRGFTPDEQAANRGAVIVNQTVANLSWPGEDPIGKRIKWGIPASHTPWLTVVGVVGDVVEGPLGSEPPPHAYVPYTDLSDDALASPTVGLVRRMTVAARSEVDAASLAAPVRRVIAGVDPALAPTRVLTMAEVVSEASAPQRLSAAALAGFAGGALLLAAIGLYGVLAFVVAQQTREIGVRMALGAKRAQVVALVVERGMRLVAIGLVLGLASALGAARLLRSLLYDTRSYDPLTFVAVPVLLAAVSLCACYLPARKAATVDPVVALRAE
jgi:putative ABC transport system permease protein